MFEVVGSLCTVASRDSHSMPQRSARWNFDLVKFVEYGEKRRLLRIIARPCTGSFVVKHVQVFVYITPCSGCYVHQLI